MDGHAALAYPPIHNWLLPGHEERLPTYTRLFGRARPFQRHGEAGHEELVFETLAQIREIAASIRLPRAVSMADVALAWAMVQPGVTSVLMGARTAAQVTRNMTALALVPFFTADPAGQAILQKLCDATLALRTAIGGANLDPYESMETSRIK